MHIIGTAGHVDHGKSALVIALTGHNPDRWREERERGMTLDLGFAPFRYDGGIEAGIIDVPGHERFLHNMLAGAAGMELLLLVIAANEGPKPQTYEHLQILNFLNVCRALVVVTKSDLVSESDLELAIEMARDATNNTIARDAPVIAVSSTSGAGIGELKAAIHAALAALPARRPDAPAYMPIDRVFHIAGHGTVVTGTLMQGVIRDGDPLQLQPSGLTTRARSLQIFGEQVDLATGGSRVAINIPGVDTADIARGETLVAPGEFAKSTDLIVDFSPVAAALALLRRRTHVRAHVGSAEIPGLLLFEDRPPLDTAVVRARLALSRPVVIYPGARLIVRRMSPKDLLGGAVVASAAGGVASEPVDLDSTTGAAETAILAVVERAGMAPLSVATIAAAANLNVSAVQDSLSDLMLGGRIVEIAKPVEYLSKKRFDEAYEKIASKLREQHASAPWKLGCTVREIAQTLGMLEQQAARLLDALHADGGIAQRGRYFFAPDFLPALTREQKAFFAACLRDDLRNALLPKEFDDVAALVGRSKIEGAAEAFEMLLATGALVRIGGDLYRRAQIERVRDILVDLLRDGSGATMAQVRDALGTSRKYALPLMEYFDSTGLTLRDGDVRRLRRPLSGAATAGPTRVAVAHDGQPADNSSIG